MVILTVAKWVGGALVGLGARQIATTVVKQATPIVASKAINIGYKVVGGLMVGGLIHCAVKEYQETIDQTVKLGKMIKDKFKKKNVEEAKVADEATRTEAE